MVLKVINTVLILMAVLMGLKQGYSMFIGKQELLGMFGRWGFGRMDLRIVGSVTMISVLMMVFPKTFVWGNFLMAAGILLIICFHLLDRDLKGVAIELPFFLLNLIILYLQYPLKRIW